MERVPLLEGLARQFRVDDPVPADAIVVLLGDAEPRATRAAELYRQGLAPVVLVTSSGDGGKQTDQYRKILIRQGVPAEAVRIIPGVVDSTRDEALRTRDYLRGHPEIRRVIVVTTDYHTGRARWTFRRTLGDLDREVDVHAAAAENPNIDSSNWYTSASGRGVYLTEGLKYMGYVILY
jgi:uncharacterized SAM-binding protein YcdF (DUF218 family)